MLKKKLKILSKTTHVETRLVSGGIAIRPRNQSTQEHIVKMSPDVGEKVWDWMHNPRIVERKEWREIREPIEEIALRFIEMEGLWFTSR